MPTIHSTGVKGFDTIWNKARNDGTPGGEKIAPSELKEALGALNAGGLTRFEAAHAAATIASDPVLTRAAAKDALAFLKTVGAGQLDAATTEAMKAEFSIRATAPFKSLSVPGREVKNSLDLPAAVQQALKDTKEPQADASWESVVVRKTVLAGQSAFIVHYSSLDDGNGDAEKVRVFSKTGQELAKGSLMDAMGGFLWE